MEIVQEIDKGKLSASVADYIAGCILKLSALEKPVLLLLSGGSALDVVDLFSDSIFSSKLTVGVVDERYSRDETINNFLQLQKKAVYERMIAQGAQSINSVPYENEVLADFAERIDTAWKNWKKENPQGGIIALMGMGPDGHTAGIMPYEGEEETIGKMFTGTDAWVAGYDAGNKNKYPRRVTSTFSFLRHEVDETIVYIAGEDKEEAFNKVMQPSGSLSATPARIFREMKSVRIFTTNKV